MNSAKSKIDNRLRNSQSLLDNTGYFKRATGEDILSSFYSGKYAINADIIQKLIDYTADEYLEEYQGE